MISFSPAPFEDLSAILTPGMRVYISAGSAEPIALGQILGANPHWMAGIEIVGSFVPGVNGFDYAGLNPSGSATSLLLCEAMRPSFSAGRVNILPFSYLGLAACLEQWPVDVAFVHLTPPESDGFCTLGPAADFAPLAWRNARLRVAFVNPALPRPPGAYRLPASEIDVWIDCEHPAIALPEARATPTLLAIARLVANVVGDGDVVQTGLGGAPAAALAALSEHRRITVHSGMVSDEFRTLAEAGALANQGHVTGIAIGSSDFYEWLPDAHGLSFLPTPQTHGAQALSARNRLIAINSALEVDLLGQANLEWRSGRLVSGVGGAPDFLAGARLSPGGRSVIALPSAVKHISRIVTRLASPSVSIPRNAIDIVVTEHGVADIRGLPMEPRAQALIGIAAPEHRDRLQTQWEELRDSF